MTTQSRSQLVDDLERYQQRGDFAAQAETLFALAKLAVEEEEHDLAHGLYGQAWAAAQQVGDQVGIAKAMRGVGDLIPKTSPTYPNDLITLRNRIPSGDENLLSRWDEMVLSLAIQLRNYHIQAETYVSISKHDRRWHVYEAARVFAYACYDITGSIPPDIKTPDNSNVHDYGHRFRDEMLTRYQHIDDTEAQAHIFLAYGQSAMWRGAYDNEARDELEQARQLFQRLNLADRLKRVLLSLMRMAYRIEDYDLYRDCHTELLALTPSHDQQEILSLLLELALIAADYEDWHTGREAYQRAAMFAVATGEAYRQCSIYWQWGQMEFKAQHYVMGERLCQWSIALMQSYNPDQVSNYQRELRQMRMRETR